MSEAWDPDSNWRRWEAPTVGRSRDPSPAKARRGKGEGGRPRSQPSDPQVTAAEIESIQEAAYNEAYNQGHAEGLEAGREAAAEQARSLTGLLDALADPLESVDEAVEQELADLVCIIARKLIRREIRTQPDQIVAVVREAVNALPSGDRRIQVQLHPEDARLIRELTGAGRQDARWELLEDPSLSRGGCVVSDHNSTVDARLEQRIGRVLAGMLGDGRESAEELGRGDEDDEVSEPPESPSGSAENATSGDESPGAEGDEQES